MDCLAEDELLAATQPGGLGDAPALQAHLAECQSCTAVVAALIVSARAEARAWGALAGSHVGRYRLDVQIGAGAMGVVYRAWDEDLGRNVAVKILQSDVNSDSLAREARIAAAIVHPHVVAIYDVGSASGSSYVVSELVDGESLRSVLEGDAIPSTLVRRAARELASGVAAAHDAGVVHRDLKPENLIMTREGALKILDFGLAKVAGNSVDETDNAAIRGTVGYMAPEQARAEPVDGRADIFAIGAILYELISGRRAFPGTSQAERLSAVLRDTPAGLDKESLGPLAPIVSRCLAKDPRDRFQSARDLAWALDQIGNDEPVEQIGNDEPVEIPAADQDNDRRSRPSRRNLIIGGLAASGLGVVGYALGRAGRAPASSPPAARQLTFRRGRIMTARFSRDESGAYFGAAWDGEALEAHSLRLDGGIVRKLGLEADVLCVSRTDLILSLDRRNVSGQCATGQLATMPIDGDRPRSIREGVQDADCTPDGELAIIARLGSGFRVEWPLGAVQYESAKWLSNPRISPDGRHLAFLVHPHTNDDAGTVALLERGSREARELSGHWPSIAGLAWSKRDELLVSASREAEQSSLWRVDLSGASRRVFEMPGRLRLHDLGASGRALVSLDNWRLRAMVATTDQGEVDRSLTPGSMVVDISSDGGSVVVAEFGDVEAVNGVYVVDTDTGERVRLGPGIPVARSPDLSRVLALRPRESGHPSPVLYASSSGAGELMATDPIDVLRWATWIDDNRLIGLGAAQARQPRLWHLDVAGGRPIPLTDEGVFGRGAVDATRSRFAFIDSQGRLNVLNLDGETRRVGDNFAELIVCGWTGSAPLVRTSSTPIEISRVDLESGEIRVERRIFPPPLGAKGVDALVLATADPRYAYSYGQELAELFLVTL